MKAVLFLVAFAASSTAFSTVAEAVTLRNSGSEAQVVLVTENGERKEVAVPANSDVQACLKGCFLTFKSGDLLAVEGGETVLIEGGKARIVAR